MELFLKNTEQGLNPLYPSDLEEKKKLKLGKVYKAEIRKPRNYEHHKKFFAMVNVGWENTELEMPFDTYRRYLIMKAGYFNAYQTDRGTLIEAQSISFSSMDQAQFEEVYSRVLDQVIKDIDTTKENIEKEILNFM